MAILAMIVRILGQEHEEQSSVVVGVRGLPRMGRLILSGFRVQDEGLRARYRAAFLRLSGVDFRQVREPKLTKLPSGGVVGFWLCPQGSQA